MSWVKITCAERDQMMAERDLVPYSSCTDLDAEFHSEPQMDIEWSERGSDQPVVAAVLDERLLAEGDHVSYLQSDICRAPLRVEIEASLFGVVS